MMETNRLSIVIDINVRWVFLPKKSPFHSVFEALLPGDFGICFSNEILPGY
jgi:hypothetical protein